MLFRIGKVPERLENGTVTVNVVEEPQVEYERIGDPSRPAGISAFLRVKNGADFVETAIRSHIRQFDEIVAVFNDCSDDTPDILSRLAFEFGERLRVFHYVPRVFPPGSSDHAAEPEGSPHSLVHYSNFSLAQTRFSTVTKLDDDHIALDEPLKIICRQIRTRSCRLPEMWCFSGLNLAGRADDSLGIPMAFPFSGSGDIGFFSPTHSTRFRHDARFERFHRGGIPRRFVGFLYWHLKYLKNDAGFANYDLSRHPNSRYHKKRLKYDASEILPLPELRSQLRSRRGVLNGVASRLNPKFRLKIERDLAVAASFPQASLETAIVEESPEFVEIILQRNSGRQANLRSALQDDPNNC